MTRPFRNLTLAALTLGATAMLASGPARAQGTEEQQEACAPDAFKFCQKAIPDIPKTTACMKAHVAQLSPRCRLAFDAAVGGDKAPSTVVRHEDAGPPPAAVAVVPSERDDDYTAQIRGYCRQGLIDPFTCRNTLSVLGAAE